MTAEASARCAAVHAVEGWACGLLAAHEGDCAPGTPPEVADMEDPAAVARALEIVSARLMALRADPTRRRDLEAVDLTRCANDFLRYQLRRALDERDAARERLAQQPEQVTLVLGDAA